MRYVILHHHIFKNAGTSLDSALSRSFGDSFATLEIDGAHVVQSDELFGLLERKANLKAVSSHAFHGQDFRSEEHSKRYLFFDFAMIRRPMSRFLSIYKHYQRMSSNDPLCVSASRGTAREFYDYAINRHPHLVNDPQVLIFANHGVYSRPQGADDLSRAWQRLKAFSLVAPIERYDEAMVALEYFLAPAWRSQRLDFAYRRQNVANSSGDDVLSQILLGSRNFHWLERANRLDEQLWKHADEELSRRICLVPDFEARLRDFRLRCAAMVEG